jgi:hypothetical protein
MPSVRPRSRGNGRQRSIRTFYATCVGFLRRLGRDVRGDDRDEPAPRVAGLNFHDGTDQPRDGRSLHGDGRFLAAMLIIAATSRDFCIGRLERLHALPRVGTRNSSATTRHLNPRPADLLIEPEQRKPAVPKNLKR